MSEDTYQLVCTCCENAPWYSICPGSLEIVNLFKHFAHIGHGERYHIVIRKSMCFRARHSVIFLEASIKDIQLVWEFCVAGQLMAGFPFVIRYRLQALPHKTSVEQVVGFHLKQDYLQ
jgi:hypothetical protein